MLKRLLEFLTIIKIIFNKNKTVIIIDLLVQEYNVKSLIIDLKNKKKKLDFGGETLRVQASPG